MIFFFLGGDRALFLMTLKGLDWPGFKRKLERVGAAPPVTFFRACFFLGATSCLSGGWFVLLVHGGNLVWRAGFGVQRLLVCLPAGGLLLAWQLCSTAADKQGAPK